MNQACEQELLPGERAPRRCPRPRPGRSPRPGAPARRRCGSACRARSPRSSNVVRAVVAMPAIPQLSPSRLVRTGKPYPVCPPVRRPSWFLRRQLTTGAFRWRAALLRAQRHVCCAPPHWASRPSLRSRTRRSLVAGAPLDGDLAARPAPRRGGPGGSAAPRARSAADVSLRSRVVVGESVGLCQPRCRPLRHRHGDRAVQRRPPPRAPAGARVSYSSTIRSQSVSSTDGAHRVALGDRRLHAVRGRVLARPSEQ